MDQKEYGWYRKIYLILKRIFAMWFPRYLIPPCLSFSNKTYLRALLGKHVQWVLCFQLRKACKQEPEWTVILQLSLLPCLPLHILSFHLLNILLWSLMALNTLNRYFTYSLQPLYVKRINIPILHINWWLKILGKLPKVTQSMTFLINTFCTPFLDIKIVFKLWYLK